MRYFALASLLLLAGCNSDNLPSCSDSGVTNTVANIAFKNLKKVSAQSVLGGDYSLDPYTVKLPIVDTIVTVSTENKDKVCKAILHLKYADNSTFALLSMSRGDLEQPIEYHIRPTDDSTGYLIDMRVSQN